MYVTVATILITLTGGCGSMYEILIQSDNFKGKSIIQQHRMVKEVQREYNCIKYLYMYYKSLIIFSYFIN